MKKNAEITFRGSADGFQLEVSGRIGDLLYVLDVGTVQLLSSVFGDKDRIHERIDQFCNTLHATADIMAHGDIKTTTIDLTPFTRGGVTHESHI